MTLDGEASLVAPDLFTTEPPQLLGGRCRACRAVFFPQSARCPFCRGTDVIRHPLSTTGTIYSFTVVRVPVPGYRGPVPYGLGVVELPDGIRVTTALTARSPERLAIGSEVTFGLIDVGGEDGPLLSYAYGMEES